jgi:sugar-specific transcriptional regulator TrmB
MDTKALENIGLTQGEVRVYIALFELGETTTGAIIKKSKITGSKVYEILEKLIEKGLVSYVIKEKTKYFQASSPKRLLDYLGKKERELFQDKKDIEGLIPLLESKQKSKEKIQSSQIFEGYEGVKTVFNLILESLKSGEEYYAFSIGDELENEKVKLFFQNYHRKRISRKIKVKIIANSRRSFFRELSKLKDLQIRYYDNPVPLGVFIFKDYVATLTFREKPTAFLIRSQQIADSYKDFFINLWEKSKH